MQPEVSLRSLINNKIRDAVSISLQLVNNCKYRDHHFRFYAFLL